MENGVEEAHLDRVNEQTLDDGVNADENEDSVSEISGLSDVSITGAGRWHPMKGRSYTATVHCIFCCFIS